MSETNNKDPAVMLYTSDFLTGTMLMTNEQVGQYIRLLCLQHQKGGYLTKKDMVKLCPTEDEDVFSKFLIDGEGRYYNKRLNIETEKRARFVEHQRENGLKGGRPSLKKDNPEITQTKPNINPNETQMKPKQKPLEDEDDNDNNISLSSKDKEIGSREEVKEIIDYLNGKFGTRYNDKAEATVKLIRARLSEKMTVADFKTVIDKKYAEWHGTEWEKFLRPVTLFGTKFESYLNQSDVINSKPKGNGRITGSLSEIDQMED